MFYAIVKKASGEVEKRLFATKEQLNIFTAWVDRYAALCEVLAIGENK